jgi:hypothetical protein
VIQTCGIYKGRKGQRNTALVASCCGVPTGAGRAFDLPCDLREIEGKFLQCTIKIGGRRPPLSNSQSERKRRKKERKEKGEKEERRGNLAFAAILEWFQAILSQRMARRGLELLLIHCSSNVAGVGRLISIKSKKRQPRFAGILTICPCTQTKYRSECSSASAERAAFHQC